MDEDVKVNDVQSVIDAYEQACIKQEIKPIPCVLEQIKVTPAETETRGQEVLSVSFPKGCVQLFALI